MALEGITGQQRAVATLEASLRSGQLAQAYLFVGPGGVGRLALARSLAGVLLCTEREDERCGSCESCRAFDAGRHPDYHEVGVPEGKQELPIATVRDLQRQAAVRPNLAGRRVFVVREAERMNIAAANCFLKTLEEPPGQCCFVLIASSLAEMPETIVSRCRLVKLAALPPREVEQELVAGGASADDAWWLARRSWGSPGLSRAFAEMGLAAFNRKLAELLGSVGAEDNFKLTDLVLETVSQGPSSRAGARLLLQDLLECLAVLYRDVAALAVGGGEAELFNRDLPEALRRLAGRCDANDLIDCADRVLEAIEHIGANANQRVVLDDLFAHLAVTCGAAAGERAGRDR